jgi:hemolysin activation/secretion protein
MRYTPSAVAVLALLCSSVGAQNIPDAGALMRQTEQMLRQDQMQRNVDRREALPPAMVLSDTTMLSAQRFKFNGNKLFTAEQLQAVVASFANRPLNQHDLQQLTHAVSEAYRQIGWVVQAYIPRQSLTGAELTVQVIETIPPSKASQ